MWETLNPITTLVKKKIKDTFQQPPMRFGPTNNSARNNHPSVQVPVRQVHAIGRPTQHRRPHAAFDPGLLDEQSRVRRTNQAGLSK